MGNIKLMHKHESCTYFVTQFLQGITKPQDSHRQQGSPVVDLREELARRAALRGEINNQSVSDQKETGDEGTTELEFDYETEF